MTPSPPSRLGLVGAGNVVEGYHLPALFGLPQFRVEWVCDQDRPRAERLAAAAGIPRAIGSLAGAPEVDIVLVAVPVGARRAVLDAVVERGWHALCEKPFAASLREHDEFVAAARRRGVRLGVGLVRRHYASTRTAARLLAARQIGPIERVLAGEGSRLRRTGHGADWYQASAQASGGGVLMETGSHLIDQVLAIFRASEYRIETCAQKRWEELEFETSVRGRLRTPEGEDAPFAFVVTRLQDVYNGIVVEGRSGQLRLGLAPDAAVELCDLAGSPIGRIPAARTGAESLFQAFQAEWLDFRAACAGSAEFSDWDTGRMTTAFLDECYARSARPEPPGRGDAGA